MKQTNKPPPPPPKKKKKKKNATNSLVQSVTHLIKILLCSSQNLSPSRNIYTLGRIVTPCKKTTNYHLQGKLIDNEKALRWKSLILEIFQKKRTRFQRSKKTGPNIIYSSSLTGELAIYTLISENWSYYTNLHVCLTDLTCSVWEIRPVLFNGSDLFSLRDLTCSV